MQRRKLAACVATGLLVVAIAGVTAAVLGLAPPRRGEALRATGQSTRAAVVHKPPGRNAVNISDVLEQERSLYLQAYVKALHEHRERHDNVVAEVLFEIPSEKLGTGVYRLFRADLVFKIDGKAQVVEVNRRSCYGFEQFTFRSASGALVEVNPFPWNGAELDLQGSVESWGPLEAWAEKWLDVNDKRYVEGKDFQGVVHSVACPETTADAWQTSVDFGTAESEAFWELIDALEAAGVERIKIGCSSALGDPVQSAGARPE